MDKKRSLEEVLEDLKKAEKEYKEKCLKYGIMEKQTRKKVVEATSEEIKNDDNLETAEQVEAEVISEN